MTANPYQQRIILVKDALLEHPGNLHRQLRTAHERLLNAPLRPHTQQELQEERRAILEALSSIDQSPSPDKEREKEELKQRILAFATAICDLEEKAPPLPNAAEPGQVRRRS